MSDWRSMMFHKCSFDFDDARLVIIHCSAILNLSSVMLYSSITLETCPMHSLSVAPDRFSKYAQLSFDDSYAFNRLHRFYNPVSLISNRCPSIAWWLWIWYQRCSIDTPWICDKRQPIANWCSAELYCFLREDWLMFSVVPSICNLIVLNWSSFIFGQLSTCV